MVKDFKQGLNLVCEKAQADYVVQKISINELHDNPYQVRKSYNKEGLLTLGENIKKNGLIQPINVIEIEPEKKYPSKRKKYYIVCGHRRVKASKLVGLFNINAIVLKKSPLENLKKNLVYENILRDELTPVEKAKSIRVLISTLKCVNSVNDAHKLLNKAHNYVVRKHFPQSTNPDYKKFTEDDLIELVKILRTLGLSCNTAKKYLDILKLPENLQNKIVVAKGSIQVKGSMSLNQAQDLARLYDEDQTSKFEVEPLVQQCLYENMNSRLLKASVDQTLKDEPIKINEKITNRPRNYQSGVTSCLKLVQDIGIITKKIISFKVDSLYKLQAYQTKTDYICSLRDLEKQTELMLFQIKEKLREKGEDTISLKNNENEFQLNFNLPKKMYRYTFPMNAVKLMGLDPSRNYKIKFKVTDVREVISNE